MAKPEKALNARQQYFSEEMIQDCLAILKSGKTEDLFDIIPWIGVLRDPRFHEPLLDLLRHGTVRKREFAALAMGAISDSVFLAPLRKTFTEIRGMKGFGLEALRNAIIEAMGAIGDDNAVHFLGTALETFAAVKSMNPDARERRKAAKMCESIIASLGAIAQQGGPRSVDALIELTDHDDAGIQAQAASELSIAYWHRPNDIDDSLLGKIIELINQGEPIVAESALSALHDLADVGCRLAKQLFVPPRDNEEKECHFPFDSQM